MKFGVLILLASLALFKHNRGLITPKTPAPSTEGAFSMSTLIRRTKSGALTNKWLFFYGSLIIFRFTKAENEPKDIG